jgi:hypothetical protein
MPDGEGRNGDGWGSGPRQVTTQRIDAWDEIIIAIRDTFLLALITFLGVVLLIPLTIITGPWVLVPYVPISLHHIYSWLYDDEPWDRVTLVWCGVFIAALLLVLPDAALVWWPWRWQATRASGWGALWPARWPKAIPAFVFVRLLVSIGGMRGWSKTWLLCQRLMQEIIAHTLNSLAFNAPDPADVEIEGWVNPFRHKVEKPPDRPRLTTNRRIGIRGGQPLTVIEGNGHELPADLPFAMDADNYIETHPEVPWLPEFPVGLFVTPTQAEAWATWLLTSGARQVSANAMHPHYASEPKSREVRDWLTDRGYCTQVNPRRWLLTDDGVALLRDVAAGRWREWVEAAVEA